MADSGFLCSMMPILKADRLFGEDLDQDQTFYSIHAYLSPRSDRTRRCSFVVASLNNANESSNVN
ncbi:hypothetical protein AKJ16_DCAP10238 [Drosera capensis]